MFKKKEVKESKLDKAIREAREAEEWDAYTALVKIQIDQIDRETKEWIKGFKIGVVTTVVGAGTGFIIGKRLAEKIIKEYE